MKSRTLSEYGVFLSGAMLSQARKARLQVGQDRLAVEDPVLVEKNKLRERARREHKLDEPDIKATPAILLRFAQGVCERVVRERSQQVMVGWAGEVNKHRGV